MTVKKEKLPGKRQLLALFRQETEDLSGKPGLLFDWQPGSRVGAVRFVSGGRACGEINLYALRHGGTHGLRQFRSRFVVYLLAEQLRLMQTAEQSPKSYLHGLACLEALHRKLLRQTVPLYLPDSSGKRRFRFGAPELYCADRAMKRALKQWGSLLSAQERVLAEQTAAGLQAMVQAPEVFLREPGQPVPGAILAAEAAAAVLTRQPQLAQTPLLQLLSGEDGCLCTMDQLVSRGEHPFCAGLVLRLQPRSAVQLPEAEQLLAACAAAIRGHGAAGVPLLRQNARYAAVAAASVTRAMVQAGVCVKAGAAYFAEHCRKI